MSRPASSRRQFLQATVAGGALVGGGVLARPGSARARALEQKTRHVVLVVFSGGVRTRETFGSPETTPNLTAMAAEGVLYPRMRTANLGHFGATMSILTGISEARGIRENSRGLDPTLFEYARKHAALEPGEVWITTSGGAQQTNYSYGLHEDYGAKYGANTLDGDGIFNREFQEVLKAFGKPRAMEAGEKSLLEKMRGSMGSGAREDGINTAESAARVEEYILKELTQGTSDVRGAGASDAKALRVARNLVALFKPRLTTVVLQDADIAHGSYNGYVEVIRRNDEFIGELWEAIKKDDELAESTAFFVLPEFGRDADLNSRRGLDHGDGSDDLHYVAGVAWGPDFRRGAVVAEEVRTIDVTPTICGLLGADAPLAKGRKLTRLTA